MKSPFTILLLILISTSTYAEEIRSKNGKRASVSANAAPKFQQLIDWLDDKGYKIDFIGGIRRGRCSTRSMHPCGKAIDINQTSRGRVTRRFPSGTIQFAKSIGIVSGSSWCNDDTGHFQIGGHSGCKRRHITTTVARLPQVRRHVRFSELPLRSSRE